MDSLTHAPQVTLHHGEAVRILTGLDEASIDSVVCDPPYGLGRFDVAALVSDWMSGSDHSASGGGLMGHDWDTVVPGPATWREVLRVLRPGGYLLAFGGTRTVDLTGLALRLAGFEIVDQIVWLHGQGWPKSRDMGAQIARSLGEDHPGIAEMAGWGSSLKPANEPIIVARKPHTGSLVRHVAAGGAGAINIEGCRIGATGRFPANVVLAHQPGCAPLGETDVRTGPGGAPVRNRAAAEHDGNRSATFGAETRPAGTVEVSHRRPDGTETVEVWDCDPDCPVAGLDAQSGRLKARGNKNPTISGGVGTGRSPAPQATRLADHGPGDAGGASRFYFCAKPSGTERTHGLADGEKNSHPSVKPVELMRWLIRLYTPAAGVVLDPFIGSGTTAVAAVAEGLDCVGVDRDDEGTYLPVAEARSIAAGAVVVRAPTMDTAGAA